MGLAHDGKQRPSGKLERRERGAGLMTLQPIEKPHDATTVTQSSGRPVRGIYGSEYGVSPRVNDSKETDP